MMKKLRNFRCSTCDKTFERMVEDAVNVVMCPCDDKSEATKCISAPGYFSNSTGRSPAAATRK
jgi:hypothetical protein